MKISLKKENINT